MIATALLLLVAASAPEDRCGYPADIYVEQLEFICKIANDIHKTTEVINL